MAEKGGPVRPQKYEGGVSENLKSRANSCRINVTGLLTFEDEEIAPIFYQSLGSVTPFCPIYLPARSA